MEKGSIRKSVCRSIKKQGNVRLVTWFTSNGWDVQCCHRLRSVSTSDLYPQGIVNSYIRLSVYKCPSIQQLLSAYNRTRMGEALSRGNCLDQGAGPHHKLWKCQNSKARLVSPGEVSAVLFFYILKVFNFSVIDNCLGIIFSILFL